jgi:hypothetical protein
VSSAQTVLGIKTFSSAPVLSGAGITAGTIQGESLVAASVVQANERFFQRCRFGSRFLLAAT